MHTLLSGTAAWEGELVCAAGRGICQERDREVMIPGYDLLGIAAIEGVEQWVIAGRSTWTLRHGAGFCCVGVVVPAFSVPGDASCTFAG